jgi:hypothetical protein
VEVRKSGIIFIVCVTISFMFGQVVGYFHLLTWVPPVAALCVVLLYYCERLLLWWKHGVWLVPWSSLPGPARVGQSGP